MKQVIVKIAGCIIILFFLNCKTTPSFLNNRYINYTDKNLKEINIDDSQEVMFDTMTNAEIQQQLEDLNKLEYKKYTININDVFDIYVDASSNFNTMNAVVKSDGYITIRRLGEIKVVDLTMEEASDEINKKLSKFISMPPLLSIVPVTLKKNRVNVLGEVLNPGSYLLEGNMRLIDAISMAGGIANASFLDGKISTANLERAYIIRKNKILPINFVELIENGNPLYNILLQDHDYIYIPSIIDKQVYILGEVNKPGKYMKTNHMTLSKLLANAGGMKSNSSEYIYILRGNGNLVKSDIYRVKIKNILRKGMPDFILQSNDMVYIPKDTDF